jgi:hypothetical protein
MYLVISLKEDQRPRFRGSDDELAEVMKEATAEAMRVLAEGVKAIRLVWVARAHPDYRRPCVKVLVRRDIGHRMMWAFPNCLWTPCAEAFFRVFEEAASRSIGL